DAVLCLSRRRDPSPPRAALFSRPGQVGQMRLLLTALLAWIVLAAPLPSAVPASAQTEFSDQRASHCRNGAYARAHWRACRGAAPVAKKPAPAQPKAPEPPTRPELTAADQEAAIIPNIPDARFWADS